MEFRVEDASAASRPTGCLVVGVYEPRALTPAAQELDRRLGRTLESLVQRGDFEGELGTTLLLPHVADAPAERVLLVGLGPASGFAESAYRTAMGAAVRTLRTTGTTRATICLTALPVDARDGAWKVEQAVLATSEALYRFEQFKSKPAARIALAEVVLVAADAAELSAGAAALPRARAITRGVELARDLGNLPGNLCTPAYLADAARGLARRHGLAVEVLEQPEIEKLGMGAFLSVARGSRQPPKLIVVQYRGAPGGSRPIVLVGKGVTFDAGGISIKTALEMDEMKFDMCGAACVLGALDAAASMKLPLDVIAIIPSTENMPDGNASKPGDIVKTMSGQTVEILDTDAEGRLVLCDALTYAERYAPAIVIDAGTLTGGVVSALGNVATGMFCNDDALAREVVEAGDRAWDRVWRMPLWDDYQAALRSNFADFPNTGLDSDCAVTAACFLSRFARKFPWVHLDIAGTASRGGDDKGATGRPVGLLTHFLLGRAATASRPG